MNSRTKASGISLKYNRKIRIFLFFLFLTAVIWFIVALSKSYTATTKIKIAYINLPPNKLLLNKPLNEMEVLVQATGFNLIKYKIKQPKITLSLIESKHKGSKYYLLPNNQITQLKQKLEKSSKIIHFLNDTIFVNLGTNISKKVPISPKLKVNFKLGYNFIEALKIKPDSIIISGSKRSLDSISEIITNSLVLNEIYENIDVQLQLKAPKWKNVTVPINTVTITGEVDKFTEGRFLVPVNVINIPKDIKITPFPKEIEVVFQAGLSNFNKISKSSFSVVFDYMQYKNDTLVQYLSPVIEQKSDLISTLKINPSQIEFLIQK
ncbi:YbbR-like domain-containing protein [Lutibacter sp.]|uniref:YbbR-like domain-containing protein n=1 Tax=Lutibacter sp. TaxID=1925666 RepID=UPI001A1A92C8|nr:YbbR-like domain-containing protein [Lutibacter sp.]MBI9041200.1 YbbR-like domain-containing protein [Lutibacter sp.]